MDQFKNSRIVATGRALTTCLHGSGLGNYLNLPQSSSRALEYLSAATDERFRQALAAMAHEADLTGGITDDQGVGRNISYDDRTGAYESVAANGDSANDGRIGADARALLNFGGKELLVRLLDFRARIQVVGEDGIRSDEDVITQRDAIPDGDAILYGDPVSYGDIGLDKGVVTDITVFADDRAVHDVGEGPDSRAFADRLRLDQRFWMYEIGTRTHVSPLSTGSSIEWD